MSATDRENRLLVAENWTKIYQSFRNADFQSYDFENLRRTMVNYLRQNYPEDFNDYIESSEYLALIDLIAFMGQNIAFRVDLNSRENFLELAERRESILRLARVISYNAKRNIAASGLLKITYIQTTESMVDSDGRQLANQSIGWNDAANHNWYDQFIRVINAAFPSSQQFGKPADSATINGIPTQQYRFQTSNTDIPVYAFTKTVSGTSMNFEITSTTFSGQSFIYEEAPRVGNRLACVYRDDGQGAGGNNSGFFLNFTQGTLNTGTFTISQPSTNESIDINTPNINNSDVWLYQLNTSGIESNQWAKVPSLNGSNIIYNSISKGIKNIFGVTTRANDAISLTFGDGTFGNLPQGTFRTYYRISNGLSYTINTQDLRNITVSLPYISANGQNNTITLTLALTTAVSNSSPAEYNSSIKANAPQQYYTQNRMITAEDYNISPLTVHQQVLKVKSVNRTSSGISRYFDLKDPTSKYSSTVLFASDGVVYKEEYLDTVLMKSVTDTEIPGIVTNTLGDILKKDNLKNFYYGNFKRTSYVNGVRAEWNGTAFTNPSDPELSYLNTGALVKFVAPIGYYFDLNNANTLVSGSAITGGSAYFIWGEVVSVVAGLYTFNKTIPAGAVIDTIIPKFTNVITSSDVLTTISANIATKKQFGLRYNMSSTSWEVISYQNLDISSNFSLSFQGDVTNFHLDASWLVLFTPTEYGYAVQNREIRYVFESDKEVRFYFDGSATIFDNQTSSLVYDKVAILSNNTNPASFVTYTTTSGPSLTLTPTNLIGISIGMTVEGNNIQAGTIVTKINSTTITINNATTGAISGELSYSFPGISSYNSDIEWRIVSEYIGVDGYIDTKKVIISFMDSNNTGVADDPELFIKLINQSNKTYIVEQKYKIDNGQEDYKYLDNSNNTVVILPSETSMVKSLYSIGQYFYFKDTAVVKKLISLSLPLETSADFKVFEGRGNIKFQYTHSADYDSRIDPGMSNIMDVYVLMNDYDVSYRQWVSGGVSTMPLPPSSNEIYNTLSASLDLIKATSDEIVYHPVSYTVLFGTKAISELQATFKVIKNPDQVISDNDVQLRVINAIDAFFAIENWNFGDTFYFSEMSAYVINKLAPYIVSFVIVPTQSGKYFGSLFEITANNNQLFISGATVNDVEIVSGITTDSIRSVSGTASNNTVLQQTITSSPYGSI